MELAKDMQEAAWYLSSSKSAIRIKEAVWQRAEVHVLYDINLDVL